MAASEDSQAAKGADTTIIDDEDEDEEEEEKETGPEAIQMAVCLYAAIGAILGYILARAALHSIKVDGMGQWVQLFKPANSATLFWVDSLLALGILGITWCWARFFQILMLEDTFQRFENIVKVIPYLSFFMILTLSTASWFFYSNIFNPVWYLITCAIIYGQIYFFTLKDFKNRVKMHLTQTVEYEEHMSLKTVSVVMGLIIVLGIAIPHLIFKSMSSPQILSLFIFLGLVAIYMTPGKIFRQIKLFPRFATAPARLLHMAKYMRTYLFSWFFILVILGFFLGANIMMERGFTDPIKNYDACCENLKQIDGALKQYAKENMDNLPDSREWEKDLWLQKFEEGRKINFLPSCPSGGRYVFKKWRNKSGKLRYKIYCSCGAHRRAGVDGLNPYIDNIYGLPSPTDKTPKDKDK